MALAAIVGVILNLILPHANEEDAIASENKIICKPFKESPERLGRVITGRSCTPLLFNRTPSLYRPGCFTFKRKRRRKI